MPASQLSLQVRRMRPKSGADAAVDVDGTGATVQSVQRNVAEAFDTLMRRLNELYQPRDAEAPREFDARLRAAASQWRNWA